MGAGTMPFLWRLNRSTVSAFPEYIREMSGSIMGGSEMSSVSVSANVQSDGTAANTGPAQWNRVMRWVRLSHMCVGLLLAPWLILYGITGFLFNHPQVATDAHRTALSPAVFEGTAFAELPSASAAAREVVAALASIPPKPGTEPPAYTLVNPQNARFDREFSYQVMGEDDSFRLSFDLERGDGELWRFPIVKREEMVLQARLPRDALAVGAKPLEAIPTAIPGVMSALGTDGIELRNVKLRKPPKLTFEMEGAGEHWLVSYDQMRRTVSARPLDRPTNMSARDYFLDLHTTNGYPSRPGARSVWAVVVDVMAFVTIAWVLTGVLMWFQMRNLRAVGAAALSIGVAGAGAVGYAMYVSFLT